MKTYELTYILSPDFSIEEAEAKAKEYEFLIQEKDGVILRSEKVTPKTLSFAIKKQGTGFYTVLEFQLLPEKLLLLTSKLQADKKVIRHMVLSYNPNKKFMKERRERKKPLAVEEVVTVKEEIIEEPKKVKEVKEEKEVKEVKKPKKEKQKVELNDIEKQLDEILSE